MPFLEVCHRIAALIGVAIFIVCLALGALFPFVHRSVYAESAPKEPEIEILKQAFYRNPLDPDTTKNLAKTYRDKAIVLFAEGETDLAISYLQWSVDLDPDNVQYHEELGDAYIADGTIITLICASIEYESVLQLGVDTPELRFKLASSLWHIGAKPRALSIMEDLLLNRGGHHYALELALWYLSEGMLAKGAEIFQRAVERSPGNHGLRVIVAIFYKAAGNRDRANAALEYVVRNTDLKTPLYQEAVTLLESMKRDKQ